jgi:hypothetical protein
MVARSVADYTVGKVGEDGAREERWEMVPADAGLLHAANALGRTGWEDLVAETRPEGTDKLCARRTLQRDRRRLRGRRPRCRKLPGSSPLEAACAGLTDPAQAWVLNDAGFALRAPRAGSAAGSRLDAGRRYGMSFGNASSRAEMILLEPPCTRSAAARYRLMSPASNTAGSLGAHHSVRDN